MGLNINGNTINDNSGGFDINNSNVGDVMEINASGKTFTRRHTANTAGYSYNGALYYTGYYDMDTYYNSGAGDEFRGSDTDYGSPNGTRGHFTAPVTGLYMCRFWSIVYPANGNRWHGYLSVNGGAWTSLAPTYTAYHYSAGGSWKTAAVTIIREAGAGDWFTFYVSDSGQFHGGYHSGFTFTLIG